MIEEDGCSVDEETLHVEVESRGCQKGDGVSDWTAFKANSVTRTDRVAALLNFILYNRTALLFRQNNLLAQARLGRVK